jgi:ABC-type uncharacterized transport system substrate-binding protein
MRRREFIALFGGAATWPLAARAQQHDPMRRIGVLTLLSGPSQSTEGFQRGLSQLGYVEGQNVIILYRWAAGRKDRLVDLAKELLQLKVDLFASQSTEAITAYIKEIAVLALDARLPSVHENREYVRAGGLMAYGPDLFALGQRAAYYVDRILKGTNPADLPIEQPTKFVLALNLNVQRHLG